MDLSYIDQLSNNGKGFLNKTSVTAKILLTISIIASVIISDRQINLLYLAILLLFLNIINKNPIVKVVHLALYPAFFSLMFIMIRGTYSVDYISIIVLKALCSALVMILLITSTPYPQIFSFFRLFLPAVVVDGMFFTYRIFFLLIDKGVKALTILRLRGGMRPTNLIFNIKNLSGVLGIIFINAFDMSERIYVKYSLRGYEGKLYHDTEWYKFKRIDTLPIALSVMIVTMVVIF